MCNSRAKEAREQDDNGAISNHVQGELNSEFQETFLAAWERLTSQWQCQSIQSTHTTGNQTVLDCSRVRRYIAMWNGPVLPSTLEGMLSLINSTMRRYVH